MTRIRVEREIPAPVDIVFRAVTDIEGLPDTNPDIVSVELLSEQRSGVGTRFRETRRAGKQEMETDLEVTELVENERARMVADSHGTVWDTVFTFAPTPEGTAFAMEMDARGHKLLNRMMNRIMSPMFRRGMKKHLAKLERYCIQKAAAESGEAG